VQDAGSQIITQSLEVKPGDDILDYCAGNGGKTFGLASAVLDTSHIGGSHSNDNCDAKKCSTSPHSKIVAHDVIDERLRQIKGSLNRVGFSALVDKSNDNGTVYVAQNRHGDCKCTIQIATSSDLDAGIKCIASCFDAVLVDAPCSSTGVLRRRPSQRWDLTEKQVYEELPQLQLEVLEKAASFVREGGRLVYSTCSLLKEENECVARKFEQSLIGSSFERWNFSPMMGSYSPARDEQSLRHTLTLLPSKNGSDGFFIARWKRRAKI
jgi:16S rRNA (cytosine967-C5)-methyltransferase